MNRPDLVPFVPYLVEPLDSQESTMIHQALEHHARSKRDSARTLYSVRDDSPMLTKDAAHALAAEHDRAADRLSKLHEKLQVLDLYVSNEG